MTSKRPAAIAIAAHPDDIEFTMAGTLCLLRRAGYETDYLNIASGSCGSTRYKAAELRRMRLGEAKRAAAALGATFHPGKVDDLEILYTVPLLRWLTGIIRQVRPTVVLTHPPQDYMEDHMNACRLAVTAACRATDFGSCSMIRSRISISPKRSNTSPRGVKRHRTTRSASADRLDRRSSSRWSRGS